MGISLQQTAAHVGADIGGFQRKLLVAAPRLHLEGAGLCQRRLQIGRRRLADGLHFLGHHAGAGKSGKTEHPGYPIAGLVQVGRVVLRLDINGGLGLAQMKVAQRGQPPAQVLHQHRLEGAAVQPLQSQLAAFDQ